MQAGMWLSWSAWPGRHGALGWIPALQTDMAVQVYDPRAQTADAEKHMFTAISYTPSLRPAWNTLSPPAKKGGG